MARWLKYCIRAKQETFICSHCGGKAYQHHAVTKDGECTYRFRPWCAAEMEVADDEPRG